MYDMILKYVFRRYEIIQPTKNVWRFVSGFCSGPAYNVLPRLTVLSGPGGNNSSMLSIHGGEKETAFTRN